MNPAVTPGRGLRTGGPPPGRARARARGERPAVRRPPSGAALIRMTNNIPNTTEGRSADPRGRPGGGGRTAGRGRERGGVCMTACSRLRPAVPTPRAAPRGTRRDLFGIAEGALSTGPPADPTIVRTADRRRGRDRPRPPEARPPESARAPRPAGLRGAARGGGGATPARVAASRRSSGIARGRSSERRSCGPRRPSPRPGRRPRSAGTSRPPAPGRTAPAARRRAAGRADRPGPPSRRRTARSRAGRGAG